MASPRDTVDNPLRRTPSQTRAMRTVDTLFEAATRILASEGEAGFTTNRIAERAGFSIGTLYQYFPSKEAIVVALVRRHRDRVMRELDVMLDRCASGEYDAEHALRLYLRHIVDAPAAIVAAMDDGAERIRSALARLDDPELPVPDEPTLYMLTRAVIGAVRSAAVEESAMLDDPRFEEALFRMVWGLVHRPGAGG
jgi:AcrR family transcriptional regulator